MLKLLLRKGYFIQEIAYDVKTKKKKNQEKCI